MMMKKIFIGLAAAVLALPTMAQNSDHNFTVAKNLDVFNTIYKNLDMLYVDTLNADQVVGYGIDAMLSSLDPYTVYYPEDKQQSLKMMLTGKYAGIGAQIRYNYAAGRVCIDEPFEGHPAAEVGLKKGDQVLSIDGEDMTHKDNAYVSEHLRGDAGTTFVLKIYRPSTRKEMKFKITRRTVQTPAVTYYGLQPNGIGYINLYQFTEGCGKDFRNAVIDMKKQGAKGLVVDLRGNGGGSEYEAVNVVNCFVPKGKLVVSNRGRAASANHDYLTQVEPVDTLMPLVVLVDGNTASASEITSGALQDMDRAVIMGTKTYGKGIVQTMLDLPYNGRMKMTTHKYYIPSGRCIQKLTYNHANGGSTQEVADSLVKVFHTADGRPVKDAGGIMPDVEVAPDSLSNLVYYLTSVRDSDEVLFNYEVDYLASHPTVASPRDFRLTDADFNEFKRRLLASHFKYDALSSKALDNLEKVAKFEGYYDGAKSEFDALKKKLTHNLEKDVDFNKKSLCEVIESDLMSAYYYQRGSMEHSLGYDKQVQEAYKLLQDRQRYDQLLQGPKK
jgi:carboxyl-terminal processing protease